MTYYFSLMLKVLIFWISILLLKNPKSEIEDGDISCKEAVVEAFDDEESLNQVLLEQECFWEIQIP